MPTLDTIVSQIIRGQEFVIGPLAWSVARKVQGLAIDDQKRQVTISDSDPKAAVDRLVAQYERLFGRASHEVCRDAVTALIQALPPMEVPSSLRASP